MARRLNGSQSLANSGVEELSLWTVFGWFQVTSITTLQSLISSTVTVGALIAIRTTGQLESISSSGAITSTSVSAPNTWFSAAASSNDSSGASAVYLNGGGKGTASDGGVLNGFGVGVGESGAANLTGLAAEIALWNVILTDPEIAALGTGICPRFVRPASLVLYCPLLGLQSPEPDMSGNQNNLTLSGAPTQANHAPVTYRDFSFPNSL